MLQMGKRSHKPLPWDIDVRCKVGSERLHDGARKFLPAVALLKGSSSFSHVHQDPERVVSRPLLNDRGLVAWLVSGWPTRLGIL